MAIREASFRPTQGWFGVFEFFDESRQPVGRLLADEMFDLATVNIRLLFRNTEHVGEK